jgi:hypothetical protein
VREISYGTLLQTEDVMQTLAPAGEMIYSVRIRGMGRFLLSLKDYEEYIAITNERTGEKEKYTWDEVTRELEKMHQPGMLAEGDWERLFGREFPKEAEVAPVQPERKVVKVNETPKPAKISKKPQEPAKALKREPERTEPKQKPVQQSEPKQETLHEIDKEIPKPKPVEAPSQEQEHVEQASEDTQEQQLPGQANIEDYPGYMPEAEISRKEFDRKEGEYREALASNIADAEITTWEKDFVKARKDLQNAISIIDKLEALYKMEIKDEEE